MAVTCGFYNALNHDRLYDAIQMSSIFDGIIRDGVFSTIGDSLIVTSPEDGMFVDVGPGRAWFNHTWTLNDTEYPVEAEEAEVVLDRIDAVVLEVNANPEVRNNRIYFVKGTPSSNPVKPTMIHNAEVNQYALAYVTIRAGQTTIFQSDIENVVGTDETPFVTGLLQQVSVEQLLLQWNDDFYRYFAAFQSHSTAEFTTWMDAKVAEYNAWYAAMEEEGAHDLEVFDTWFQHMKDQLDEDAAGHLQAEIDELAEACEKGSVFTVSTEEPELVGRSCVVSQGSDSVTKQFNSSGVAEFPSMPYIGSIHVEATDGDNVAQGEMTIPYFGRYSMSIAFWAATLNISTSADGLISRPITITKGGVVVGTTSFNASGRATYKVHEPGTYIVSSSTAGGDEYSATVVVTEETAYPVNLGIPSGATATPTDDIQIWLKCASIYDKSYTLLADVLEDYYTCERLFSDSNACDYMARSSSWAAIVTTDASVMEQIGKYDYCCSKLLENATWAAAIINSSYADYILFYERGLAPVMTSNTTPSGLAFSNNNYSSNTQAWKAFDGTILGETDTWATYYATGVSYVGFLGYHFTSAKIVKGVKITNRAWSDQNCRVHTFKVQGSNDSTTGADGTWTDISDIIDRGSSANASGYSTFHIFNNTTAYSWYRILILTDFSPDGITGVGILQFYGEPQTDLIHSAALDTIYYYDENSVERQLCVTDANGNGTVDWSEMEPGIYTFYSTVAKNPDNLSEEYSKTVKITKTTTEVYLMPENALYWYGYEDENLGDISTVNGWTSGSSFTAPNKQANYLSCITGSGILSGVGSKRKISNAHKVDIIAQGVTIDPYSRYGMLIDNLAKNTDSGAADYIQVQSTALSNFSIKPTISNFYEAAYSATGGRMNLHAFWNITERELTVFSAANDTIYYLGENNVHIPFAKTDETGTASVDLGLIPQGTYTLYSSVAKDPDNLSNPYSKTITIGPDTKSVKVMPDGALYWYGYDTGELEDVTSANGWSGNSFAAPSHNANYITMETSGNVQSGIGSKNKYMHTNMSFVYENTHLSNYGNSVERIVNSAKNVQSGGTIIQYTTLNTKKLVSANVTSNNYICVIVGSGGGAKLHALWYE